MWSWEAPSKKGGTIFPTKAHLPSCHQVIHQNYQIILITQVLAREEP